VGADEARVCPPDVAGDGLRAAANGVAKRLVVAGALVLLVASVMLAGGGRLGAE